MVQNFLKHRIADLDVIRTPICVRDLFDSGDKVSLGHLSGLYQINLPIHLCKIGFQRGAFFFQHFAALPKCVEIIDALLQQIEGVGELLAGLFQGDIKGADIIFQSGECLRTLNPSMTFFSIR